jgi:hypothetical protein
MFRSNFIFCEKEVDATMEKVEMIIKRVNNFMVLSIFFEVKK